MNSYVVILPKNFYIIFLIDAETQRKTDNRVKNVHDMMEEVKLKMEDLERWETLTNESSQSVDYR